MASSMEALRLPVKEKIASTFSTRLESFIPAPTRSSKWSDAPSRASAWAWSQESLFTCINWQIYMYKLTNLPVQIDKAQIIWSAATRVFQYIFYPGNSSTNCVPEFNAVLRQVEACLKVEWAMMLSFIIILWN